MFALILACTTPSEIEEQPAELPDAWVEHYSAESLIQAGGFEFEEAYIVRRFLDPGAGSIREEFIATADGTLTEVYLDVDPSAESFTLSFSDESYQGTGTFEGPAWAWTGWRSESVAPDGASVLSVDTQQDGAIHAEKEGFSADGELEWTLVEDLSPIEETLWQQEKDALDG